MRGLLIKIEVETGSGKGTVKMTSAYLAPELSTLEINELCKRINVVVMDYIHSNEKEQK